MAAPFFQALLKNLPTILSVGHGLFNLFTQAKASKQENDKVIQAFQLLRDHQDDLDRLLVDRDRQRVLMEGYSILLRRVQELERNRSIGGGERDRRDNFRDVGYGFRQVGYHNRDDGYRSKGDFSDDFGRRNNYRGRDDFRRDDSEDSRRWEELRNEIRRDLRRREGSPEKNKPSSSAKGDSSKTKAQLRCDVCREKYNSGRRRPTLLPTCGHTFCRACLVEVSRREHLRCPVCRSDPFMDVGSLPTNRPILDMIFEDEANDGETDLDNGGAYGYSNGNPSRDYNPSCGNYNFICGNDNPSCRNDNPSCGNDDPSCGNDNPSCGNDNPSCGSGSNGLGDDDSNSCMMSFEEQIQLAILWSREEMSRTNINDSTPFGFLDYVDRDSEDEEMARALSLSMMGEQNDSQQSQNDSECSNHANIGVSSSHFVETCEEEEVQLYLAIQMSLEAHNTNEPGETGREATTGDRGCIEEYRLAHEPQFTPQRMEELVQCSSNPRQEYGNRDWEREELERERERLRREKEDWEREKEEWRKKIEKKNKEKAKKTLTSLGCFTQDSNSKKESDDCCEDDSDDDCNEYEDCCSDDDNDDDIVCGKLKLKESKEGSCTESEDECEKTDDICAASSVKLEFCDSEDDCKIENDTVSNSSWWKEEEKKMRKIRKKKQLKIKEEEQLQLAMAISLSLHEAESAKTSEPQ